MIFKIIFSEADQHLVDCVRAKSKHHRRNQIRKIHYLSNFLKIHNPNSKSTGESNKLGRTAR